MNVWFIAFPFTQLVEVPIYVRTLNCSIPVAFGASAMTHPLVRFGFFNPWIEADYWSRVIAAELFAWLVEAAYFAFLFHKRHALRWALVANGASVSTGLLSRALFGIP